MFSVDYWNSSVEDPGKFDVLGELARIAKALSHGKRLELVELLAQRERSVDALASLAGMGVTTVSSHLQILKQAGLVQTRRTGTTIHYRLAGDDVAALYVAMKRVGIQRLPDLRDAVSTFMADDYTVEPDDAVIDTSAITADTVVLDVRPAEEYEAGHFPGAVSIPLNELEQRHSELPAGRPVVVYCRGQFCKFARVAARWLRSVGYSASATDEGVLDWRVSPMVELDSTE